MSSTISGKQEIRMRTFLWITGVILTAIPILIAEKRKCKNLPLIYLLGFFLSWTIIGWVAAMAWAIWGEPDPERFPKAVR
jgi:Superinfection immunity protein